MIPDDEITRAIRQAWAESPARCIAYTAGCVGVVLYAWAIVVLATGSQP